MLFRFAARLQRVEGRSYRHLPQLRRRGKERLSADWVSGWLISDNVMQGGRATLSEIQGCFLH